MCNPNMIYYRLCIRRFVEYLSPIFWRSFSIKFLGNFMLDHHITGSPSERDDIFFGECCLLEIFYQLSTTGGELLSFFIDP